MPPISLLVGNDINNATQQLSWSDLLTKIIARCGVEQQIAPHKEKPFPLLYEEIFLTSLQKNRMKEVELKKYIAEEVSRIQPNEIHARIRALRIPHIMTTNYEYSLEGKPPKSNSSLVKEQLYSVFRCARQEDTTYWHVHGECRSPRSINLGYEHYGGQLQQLRNYVVTGTLYQTDKILKDSLEYRLREKQINYQSWLDLFFMTNVHIFGLSLDFSETDLWWLLTFRARLKFYKEAAVNNELFYYVPDKFAESSKFKLEMLQATGVTVVVLPYASPLAYYHLVLDEITKAAGV